MKKLIFVLGIILSLMVIPGMVIAHGHSDYDGCSWGVVGSHQECGWNHYWCHREGYGCHYSCHTENDYGWICPEPEPIPETISSSFIMPFQNDIIECQKMDTMVLDGAVSGGRNYKAVLISPIGFIDTLDICYHQEVDTLYNNNCTQRIYYNNGFLENKVSGIGIINNEVKLPTQRMMVQGSRSRMTFIPYTLPMLYVLYDDKGNVWDKQTVDEGFVKVYDIIDTLENCRTR